MLCVYTQGRRGRNEYLINAHHFLGLVPATIDLHKEIEGMAAAPRSMQVNRRVKCIHTHIHTLHLMFLHPIGANKAHPHNLMRRVLLPPLHSHGKGGREEGR